LTTLSHHLRHYQNNHNEVPTWVLTKLARFTNFISLIDCSKADVKNSLCDLYGMHQSENGRADTQLLIGSLHYIRHVRNACAHNERVYDVESYRSRRISCSYFDLLPRSYFGNSNTNKRVMDFIVYMRYYMDDETYQSLIDDINLLLLELQSSIRQRIHVY